MSQLEKAIADAALSLGGSDAFAHLYTYNIVNKAQKYSNQFAMELPMTYDAMEFLILYKALKAKLTDPPC